MEGLKEKSPQLHELATWQEAKEEERSVLAIATDENGGAHFFVSGDTDDLQEAFKLLLQRSKEVKGIVDNAYIDLVAEDNN